MDQTTPEQPVQPSSATPQKTANNDNPNITTTPAESNLSPPSQPDPLTLLQSWTLPPSTHSHILHTTIIPAHLPAHLPPSRPASLPPLAILLLGQTGAGKTRLAPLLLSALTPRNPLHLIADTFKVYHPHYRACLALLPGHASRLAGGDAAGWLAGVCGAAAREGVDVLVEAAGRRKGDVEGLVEGFVERGYEVRVVVLGVAWGVSRLGTMVRYYKRLPEAGSGGLPVRLTPRGVHEESYKGVEEVVRWVEGEEVGGGKGEGEGETKNTSTPRGRVGRIAVVRRNGFVAYANERGADGRWKHEAMALRTLDWERARGLLPEERRAADEDLAMLRGLGDPKVDRELDEIEPLIHGLGTEEVERRTAAVDVDMVEFITDGV